VNPLIDDLAELGADLRAWLEWQQSLGAVSWPREQVPRSVREEPARRSPQNRQPEVTQVQAPAEEIAPPPNAAPGPSKWDAYIQPAPLAVGSGPTSAKLALVWTGGASPEAEAMLDKMMEGVLGLKRSEISVVTLTRTRATSQRFRAELIAQLDRLEPGLILVMGTLGTRAILGESEVPGEARQGWHTLQGSERSWDVRITHHPEHIQHQTASGDQESRREAFEDLQAVSARLA